MDETDSAIVIDGSQGEGGGQILRTSLSLAALTGRAFKLEKIRAGRSKPGLRPQHLTAVRAAAATCDAVLIGDEISSQTLEFWPSQPAQSGSYLFDVCDAAPNGRSAGSVTLILQTVLWPLLYAAGESRLALRGGTHVHFSPSFYYMQHVTREAYRRFGVDLYLELTEFGWTSAGGGQIIAELTPLATSKPLRGVNFNAEVENLEGNLKVAGIAVVTNLPGHIPHRMARRADNLLKQAGYSYAIEARRLKGGSAGAGICLWPEDRFAGAHGLGHKGKAAQDVAEDAVKEIIDFLRSGASVGPHLADQLLIPAALAQGETHFTTCELTQHTLTNREIIETWLPVKIEIEGELGRPATVRVNGIGWG
ncbi:MAG: RNA 3'-terminal phosphate cyclase [Chloroflexota bacterium]